MKQILFVCTGNICRSSMAEGLFRKMIERDEKLKGKISTASAGTSAFDGEMASSNSVKVLRSEWGVDIRSHRSRAITKELIDKADLILTMTREHKRAIIRFYPDAKQKVFTLKEYVVEGKVDENLEEYNFALDVADPYGMPEEVYRRCAFEIQDALQKLVMKLKREIIE
ncbi:MAG: low molecular weight protein arginine phosphatase [Clostridia bacterium]|nr:low molecular weight protein arginine phosphatase [Clostridia bacterium]